ncbi:unnamed protein product, partial [Owenia fusiformis]
KKTPKHLAANIQQISMKKYCKGKKQIDPKLNMIKSDETETRNKISKRNVMPTKENDSDIFNHEIDCIYHRYVKINDSFMNSGALDKQGKDELCRMTLCLNELMKCMKEFNMNDLQLTSLEHKVKALIQRVRYNCQSENVIAHALIQESYRTSIMCENQVYRNSSK